ncbi:MAG: hypothetical protein H6712_26395 [Myxococcales bacterium]|nr:hypothetical protein [Myxococcales bacterium]MCB9717406.1 hypothetical protein [Myxococcales bacterium]
MLAILALFFVLVPSTARAELQIAGGKPERSKLIGKLETHHRRGINVGASVRMGAVGIVNTFVPAVRAQYEVGGGISDRFTLGLAVGGTAYLGLDKGSFNADLVGHRFFGKGFFLRGALGVSSHVPALASVPMSPGIGGSVGMGWEFRLFDRLGMGLGADYDLRMRTDGRLGQAWFFGLRFTGYLDKKHR